MASMSGSSGTLFVVSTPIGNLEDLSPRAQRVLAEVDVIAAEDTRHTRGLLSRIGVVTPTFSYHDHNETERAHHLIRRLESGENVALVSDAGTPLISDPGYVVVKEARSRDLAVVPIPGPSALMAALSVAGLPTDRWVFEGFLPRRETDRKRRIGELSCESRTLVFFESVHRMKATLEALAAGFGEDRKAFVGRELTKVHEQTTLSTLSRLAEQAAEGAFARGELVLVVAGAELTATSGEREAREIHAKVSEDLNPKDAIRVTARLTGLSRNTLYRLLKVADESSQPQP